MLTVVKNQIKITFLTIKYGLMREMLNKATFISNVVFMILNNSTMIIQWLVLYSIKEEFGGYSFNKLLLLWGLFSFVYGFSHFFFKNAFILSETINNGKLDAYIVQPKNILISSITSGIETSGLGDMLYGYIMLIFHGVTITKFILFTLFGILGGLAAVAFTTILNSLSFWIAKSDVVSDTGTSLLFNFSTYPEGIFNWVVKLILYTIVPVGLIGYMPVNIISEFNLTFFLIVLGFDMFIIALAFIVFYRGLRRYSSSNLMIARI